MADHELRPEEGLRLLDEVFGSASAPPTRGRRKYVLVFSPKILRHELMAQSELTATLVIERERPCAVDQVVKRNKQDRQ
jgi:hypothetical protein